MSINVVLLIRSSQLITTDGDEVHVVETLFDPAQQFTVLYEIITIMRCEDHLLIQELFFIEILRF